MHCQIILSANNNVINVTWRSKLHDSKNLNLKCYVAPSMIVYVTVVSYNVLRQNYSANKFLIF